MFLLVLSCESGKTDLPDSELETLGGDKVNLRDFSGKPILLYIWSGTCVGHTKDLKRLTEIDLGNVEVISLAIGMEREDVEKTYSQIGISPKYVTLLDKKIEISDHITLVFLPYTLLYDERGTLIKKLAKLPDSEEEIKSLFQRK